MSGRAQTLIFKICFITSFIVTSLVALLIAVVLYGTLRLVSVDFYRKAIWYLMVGAYAHVAFVADWWSLLELNLYMNKDDFRNYFGKEHALLIINHSYDIDWLPLVSICARMNLLGNIKIFVKRSLQYIPILGWSFILTDYVLLHRSYKKDLKIIQDSVRSLATYPYPLWQTDFRLPNETSSTINSYSRDNGVIEPCSVVHTFQLLLYPEGTWPTEDSFRKSRAYAEKMCLPQLKHHLQPRTAGFVTTLREMRGRIKVVYNVEIAFREGQTKPCCSSVLEGKQMIADIYIKRISEADIPMDRSQQEYFLREMFQIKVSILILIPDRLRDSFIETGSFFAESDVPVETRFKIERPLYVVVVFFTCCSLVLALTFYALMCLYRSYGLTAPVYVLTAISTCSIVIFNAGISATIIQNE
ncbi:hypothetical protein Trydic_g12663 [Trypoxylus dichotomus]